MELKSTFGIFVILSLTVAQNNRFLVSRQQFAWDLFKNTPMTTSFAISPLSLDFVMNLMFLGTSKSTINEVKDGLEYPKDFSVKNIEANLLKWSTAVRKINGVEVATKIYANVTLSIKNSYKLTIRQTLNSDLEKIAFKKSKPATKKINKWIANATHNLIQNMIAPGVIDKDTLLILVNCIYFGGKWNDPFQKDFNYEGNFTTEDGSIKQMEFMYQDSKLNFSSNVDELKGASAVSMNYYNTSVSMLFVLPPNDTSFRSWLSSIQTINWSNIDNTLSPVDVRLSIPKFKITFDKDMKETLKNMGLKSIFEDETHLDKIFTGQKAKVSNLFHKTVLSVDETGTVAVGAAVMKISSYSMKYNQQEFIANRPFLFIIKSGPTILFIGQYVG